jgi:hypothetical protein
MGTGAPAPRRAQTWCGPRRNKRKGEKTPVEERSRPITPEPTSKPHKNEQNNCEELLPTCVAVRPRLKKPQVWDDGQDIRDYCKRRVERDGQVFPKC